MPVRSLAKFANGVGVLLVTALTIALTAPRAEAQQSARIQVSANVVRPAMSQAVLDTALADAVTEALRTHRMWTERVRPLPAGAQLRTVRGEVRVRELRVEYVGN